MEAGLPDVTGDDSGGAWHLSQLVERASQPHYNVSWLPPAAPAVPGISLHLVICSTAVVRSALYSPVFVMGFGNNKAYAATNYNQQSSLKC